MPEISEQDRQNLAMFFGGSYRLVRTVALEQSELFPAQLRNDIALAWKEFEDDFDVQDAVAKVRQIESGRAVDAGLYGAQLRLKLSVVRYWQDQLTQRTFPKKIVKRVFDAIDTVLDSILAATGVGEALKEIKDILSDALD